MTDLVNVFIASRRPAPYRRLLWRMTRADAMRVCSDPRTSNNRHMLCWTAASSPTDRLVPDNGYYDEVLADLGVEVRAGSAASPVSPARTSRSGSTHR